MDDFAADVNRVIRYSADEDRKGFEKVIEESPTDVTNHLVYADWLKENGHTDEEDFRRHMAEWHRDGNLKVQASFHKGFPFRVSLDRFPSFVRSENLPHVHTDPPPTEEVVDGNYVPTDHTLNREFYEPRQYGGPVVTRGWRSYRGMETAFRNAFMEGRKHKPTE